MSKPFYSRIICGTRRQATKTPRTLSEELTSDKNRIIFSNAFRRLQQKAQVFSLETNASVRSRLTHTLEVATIGLAIAEKIVDKLIERDEIEEQLKFPFIKIVENACLLHDIGNPPFGHFAEEAIKKWFTENWQPTFMRASKLEEYEVTTSDLSTTLINDFKHFDGNPQGLRIVTKLQDIPETFSNTGLNLTISQIMAAAKYTGPTTKIDRGMPLRKKAGYFLSEQETIDMIRQTLKVTGRFPLTYIMEAADDISYCISDIEDGIEKRVFTSRYFFEKLNEECIACFGDNSYHFATFIQDKKTKFDFFTLKINLVRMLESHVVGRYLDKHEEVLNGTLPELIDKHSPDGKILQCLKTISRKYLFRSREAENKELAGYHAISGLLEKYRSLLELPHGKFYNLVSARQDLDKVLGTGMDLQWRLFNRLPEKYVEAYKHDYRKLQSRHQPDDSLFLEYEWFYRAHLIVDYLSGMTDNFLLETYHSLYGIKIS